MEIASYKRCSRPLCSSQTTTPYHTPHTPTLPPKRAKNQPCMIDAARKPETQVPHHHPLRSPVREPGNDAMVLLSQDPTVCQTLPTRNLHRSVPGTPTPQRRNVFRTNHRQKPDRHLFVDIPPMSTRRRTIVCATGLLPDNTTTQTMRPGGIVVGAP